MYFYLSSLLTPLLSLSFIVFYRRRQLKKIITSLSSFLLAFAFSSAPFFYHSFSKYNFLTSRSSVFALASQENSPFLSVVINQFSRFFKGFYSGSFNGSGMHYLNLPLFPYFFLFFTGLFYSLFTLRQKGHFEFLAIFSSTSLFGGLLTEAPPAPQRLIHLFPLSAVFIFLGLKFICRSLPGFKKTPLLLILSICFLNLFSFVSQNLTKYQKIPKPAYSFYQYYRQSNHHYPVYTHIPLHLLPQIFFYSKGQISPQPINFSSALPPFLFLTDPRA